MALTASQVELLYVAFYNRPADPAGLAYWESSSATYGQAANYFGASPEYTAMFTGLTNTQVVAQVYENMFNRLPDPAGLIYWSNLLTAGTLTLGSIALAIAGGAQGTDATILANKVTAATDFTNNIVTTPEILAYSGAAANHQASLWLDTVGSSPSSLTGALGTEAGVIAALIAPVIGTTSTLTTNGTGATFTTGITVPAGALVLNDLSGAATDTITAPAGATINASYLTINGGSIAGVADAIQANLNSTAFAPLTNVTINGGSGTAAATTVLTAAPTLTINGGSTANISDSSAGHNAITSLSLNGESGAVTLATNLNALTSLSLTSEAQSVAVVATAGTRAQTLTLNGVTGGTVTDATATTLNIVSSGTATTGLTVATAAATTANITSNVATTLVALQDAAAKTVTINGSANTTITTLTDAAATTINVSGTAGVANIGTYTTTGAITGIAVSNGEGFTSNVSGLSTLATLTASGAGVITATLNGTVTAFTGGAGQDVITIGQVATQAIAGGTAANNEIIFAAAANAAGLGTVTGFTTLGTTGLTSGSFNMAKIAGITALDVQAAGVTGFTNVVAGTTLTFAAANATAVNYQTADSTGASDTLALTLGTSNTTGIVVAGLTAQDSVSTGLGTINLTSNATSAGAANTITTLNDSGLASFTQSGAGELIITNALVLSGASFAFTDNSTSTAVGATFTAGITDTALTTLTLAGSNTKTMSIGGLATSAAALTINDRFAGTTALGAITDSALTTLTLNNTGAGAETLSSSTLAALASLTLSGSVAATIAGDAVTTGITVAGSSDNAVVIFTSTGVTAATKTDSVTLGNGVDAVTLGAGAATSTQTVVLGTGAGDTITSASVGTVNATVGSGAADTITASGAGVKLNVVMGNGAADSVTAAGAADSGTITVGTAANTVTVNGAADTLAINFGAHTATTVDAVSIGNSGITGTGPAMTAVNIDVITGLNNVGVDTVTFNNDLNDLVINATFVTAANVIAAGLDATSLKSWISVADGAALGGHTAGAVHSLNAFVFGGNTYLVESVAGNTANAGTMTTANTVVELTGVYTLAAATGAAGVLHLLG